MAHRQTILVIDDSIDVHRLIEVRLRRLAVDLLHANRGDEGIELACDRQPDLILLDVDMPGIDGFETCHRLKGDPATHDIPVIFLTGSRSTETVVRGFDLGAVDYIIKPFEPAELSARIRAALHTKQLIDMLAEQVSIDGLSGLHNRRYFDERLGQEIEAAMRYDRSVGLLLIDVDHFKTINDTAGHPVGDHVLKTFAIHLQRASRACDVPCRFGGDEFALILPEANETHAFDCGQRLMRLLHGDAELQGLLHRPITASIGGAATRGPNAVRADELVRRADQALYKTKQRGRNGLTVTGLPAHAA